MPVKRRIDRTANLQASGSETFEFDTREGRIALATFQAEAAVSNHEITVETIQPNGTYSEISGSPVDVDRSDEYEFTFTEFNDRTRVTINNQAAAGGDIDMEVEFHDGDSAFKVANESPSLVSEVFDIDVQRDIIDSAKRRIPSSDVSTAESGFPGPDPRLNESPIKAARDAFTPSNFSSYEFTYLLGNYGGPSGHTSGTAATNRVSSSVSTNVSGTSIDISTAGTFSGIGSIGLNVSGTNAGSPTTVYANMQMSGIPSSKYGDDSFIDIYEFYTTQNGGTTLVYDTTPVDGSSIVRSIGPISTSGFFKISAEFNSVYTYTKRAVYYDGTTTQYQSFRSNPGFLSSPSLSLSVSDGNGNLFPGTASFAFLLGSINAQASKFAGFTYTQ